MKCDYCGKEFKKYLSSKQKDFKHHFCCRKCSALYQKRTQIKKVCGHCGKEFFVPVSRINAKYCSNKCKYADYKKNIIIKKEKYAEIIISSIKFKNVAFKIDLDKIEEVQKHYFIINECKNGLYARTCTDRPKYLHQIIMNTPKGMDTDHINRDTTDNRVKNLRICSHIENMQNKVNNKACVGVKYREEKHKFEARITYKRKIYVLGLFNNFEEAKKARKKAEVKYYGKLLS